MQYMLMIVEPRGQRLERSLEAGRAAYQHMLEFADELKAKGSLVGAGSLASDSKGVRVQVRERKRQTLDGPFSEAKEMIGGYFLVDCETREDAIAIAADCPAAEWATVEVRPIGPCYL